MNVTIQKDENGEAIVEIPTTLMQSMGLRIGDVLDASIRDEDGTKEIVLQAWFCPGEHTVVEDRYGGGYSGAAYVAWPLPAAAIPTDSQGGDVPASQFWAHEHLAGKGDTPEAALADLERQVALIAGATPGPLASDKAAATSDAVDRMRAFIDASPRITGVDVKASKNEGRD